MKYIEAKLGSDREVANIYPLADIHFGSPSCSLEKLRNAIDIISNDPNGFVVLLGDIIDNATRNSVGDPYMETLSPMDQIKTAIEFFRPISDKIIAVTTGNHEDRTYRNDGIDLTAFFCAELGLSDVYDYGSCVLAVRVGKDKRKTIKTQDAGLVYTLYLSHGSGGGRTPGSKANMIKKFSEVVNTDVCVVGHQHTPMSFMDGYFDVDVRNHKVIHKDTLYVMCSSFLNYERYAESKGMVPTTIALPKITVNGTKKQVVCSITQL